MRKQTGEKRKPDRRDREESISIYCIKRENPAKSEGKTEAHNATSLALPVNNTI
jgi:hypothetical protein